MFKASQFIPTQWDTATTKAKFANQFMKFVKGGFQEKDFPKWFYSRLSNTFGHIAHYDQYGFYEHFFSGEEGKLAFLRHTQDWGCYGQPEFTYCDVEREIQKWLFSSGEADKVRSSCFGMLKAQMKQEIRVKFNLLSKEDQREFIEDAMSK
jgi:hypothetical protein